MPTPIVRERIAYQKTIDKLDRQNACLREALEEFIRVLESPAALGWLPSTHFNRLIKLARRALRTTEP